MNENRAWRELYRCESLKQARTIITSISAMEFEVRLRNELTGRLVEAEDKDGKGQYLIEARSADLQDLAEVLDQIVDEQREFDAFLEGWHSLASRSQLLFFALAGIIILLLAVLAVLDW